MDNLDFGGFIEHDNIQTPECMNESLLLEYCIRRSCEDQIFSVYIKKNISLISAFLKYKYQFQSMKYLKKRYHANVHCFLPSNVGEY